MKTFALVWGVIFSFYLGFFDHPTLLTLAWGVSLLIFLILYITDEEFKEG